jgi:acyl-CoA thioesterase I
VTQNNLLKTGYYVRFASVLLALALFAAGGCAKSPKLARLAPGDVVLAFGDSLTYGTGASAEQSYPAVLGQLIKRTVIRAGVPGEVTEQGLRRLPQLLEAHKPALVILCLGGNDILRKHDQAATKSNLHSMLTLLKERRIGVMLVGVPQPSLFSGPPAYYGELAKEFGVPYEGAVVKEVLYTADMKSDPIHPNARGYARMAEALASALKSAGAL